MPALPLSGAVLSSTYSVHSADLCIDGEWPRHIFCHSNDEHSPWLEIDLGFIPAASDTCPYFAAERPRRHE